MTCPSYDKSDKIGSILALIQPNLIPLLFLHGSHVGIHYEQVLTWYAKVAEADRSEERRVGKECA